MNDRTAGLLTQAQHDIGRPLVPIERANIRSHSEAHNDLEIEVREIRGTPTLALRFTDGDRSRVKLIPVGKAIVAAFSVLVGREPETIAPGEVRLELRARRFRSREQVAEHQAVFGRNPRREARVATRPARPRERRETAGRSSSRRSSERSGSSGDDGPSDEPPPQLCELPGFKELGRRKYCCELHATRHRLQRKRERDRDPDVLVARARDRLERDGYRGALCPDDCGGKGFYVEPELAVVCVKCGRPKLVKIGPRNGYDGWLADRQALMRELPNDARLPSAAATTGVEDPGESLSGSRASPDRKAGMTGGVVPSRPPSAADRP